MKRPWARSVLLVLLLLLPAACRVAPIAPEAPTQPDVGAALQGLLDAQVQEQGILGMAMALRLADGTVVFRQSGSTVPGEERPWTLDTQSALGSVTKTFTAVVVMQLVEEGKLTLDGTIDAWFPDQPNAGRITVRMLLSHTGGLNNPIPPNDERNPKWARAWPPLDFIAEANRRGPVAEPGGDVAHYSNTGYFLLGLIIEAVTGNSWEQEVRTRIIEPLALHDTTFADDPAVWGEQMVPGHAKTADGYTSTWDIPDLPHASTAWAAGGIVSTTADLLTFAGALFDGKLVGEESLAEMATPLAKDAETGILWGLGGGTLESLPPGSFGMGGDVPGYHAFFSGVRGTNLVTAALINTEEGDVVAPSLMALDYLLALPPAP